MVRTILMLLNCQQEMQRGNVTIPLPPGSLGGRMGHFFGLTAPPWVARAPPGGEEEVLPIAVDPKGSADSLNHPDAAVIWSNMGTARAATTAVSVA